MPNSTPNHLEIDDLFMLGAEQQSRRKSQSLILAPSVSGKETGSNYTNRAIISFVDAISKMNEEVLVPSRLRDVFVRDQDATDLMPPNSDLYSFYQMLNTVKKDLFSSTLYYKTFQPVTTGCSQNNSGQNSGRVTPTHSLSRRSSYSLGAGNTANVSNTNATSITNGTSVNGTTCGSGQTLSSSCIMNRTSPTQLMPPLLFERKLSSPCPMVSPSPTSSGAHSPSMLFTGTGLGVASGDQSPTEQHSPTSSSGLLQLPQLSLSYVSRATSLNSLLAQAGHLAPSNMSSAPESLLEERVQQITGCFMYHLSALYTIMGHFTKAANYITKRYHEEMDNQ